MNNVFANKITVNTRCLGGHTTGVQRYTYEIIKQFGSRAETIAPTKFYSGFMGHMWEQITLPRKLKGGLLWSPANTGPINYAHQVVTIHDVAPLEHPSWFNYKFCAWYKFILPKLAKNTAHIITVSQYSASKLAAYLNVPYEKISVVYCGVSQDIFYPLSHQEADAILTNLNLPDGRYVVSLSSIAPSKNLASLLASWKMIVNKLPEDIYLILVGKPSSVTPLVDFSNLPERVILLGYVDDKYLPALYSRAMLFVYISLYEGFGLPVLEAMACGAPVIASNICSLPEVAGEAAVMADPYAIDDVADKMLKVLSKEALMKSCSIKGLERAKNFSWSTSAKKIWQILEQV